MMIIVCLCLYYRECEHFHVVDSHADFGSRRGRRRDQNSFPLNEDTPEDEQALIAADREDISVCIICVSMYVPMLLCMLRWLRFRYTAARQCALTGRV